VDFFDELSTTNRFLGPIFSFFFGFFVVFMAMNLLISILNQGLYEAKLISRERRRHWSCWRNIGSAMQDIMYLRNYRRKGKIIRSRNLTSTLQPHRLEGMKKMTVYFLQESLRSSEVQKLREMKLYLNNILERSGYRIISRVCRRHREEMQKELHIDLMRKTTADFLRMKLGTEMTGKELMAYSDANRAFMNLRVDKLDQLLIELNERLDLLLDYM
jgi:hypothetical protein